MLGIVSSYAIVTLSLRCAGFPIFDFRKCRDLENRVRGLSRSLEISPFDRARTTSCWHSIVTMALSCVISEIHVEKCHDLEIGVKGHSRSSELTRIDPPHVDFLLTFHSNHWPISHHFWDSRQFLSKIANFSQWWGSPWNWVLSHGVKKLEWWGYRAEEDVWRYLQPCGYNPPMRPTDE